MTDVQKWLLFAGVIFAGWLIYLLAPMLTPFLTAALLAYLADPLADRLEARKLSRTGAVLVVFLLMFSLLALILLLGIPLLERQLVKFIARIPDALTWLQQNLLPALNARLGLEPDVLSLESLQQSFAAHWKEAGGVAAHVLAALGASSMGVLHWVTNLLLIPVITFYLLRDWDVLVARVQELLPRPVEPKVAQLARESDQVLGAFLRGQLSVMVALGVIYAVGLAIIGLDFALLIGMLAGLLSFVPYLGFIVGLLTASLAVLMQSHDLMHLVPVLIVFGVGQVIEGAVLTPWLVGDRIGLHPVAVIFAVLAGGELFGFVGVLLALPTAAVLAVVLRHVHAHYRSSPLYEGRSPPTKSA
ncbi:MAG: AI-2E family transporter [Gammaproteobacteria bacterium]